MPNFWWLDTMSIHFLGVYLCLVKNLSLPWKLDNQRYHNYFLKDFWKFVKFVKTCGESYFSPRRRSDQESWLHRCHLLFAVFCIFGRLGSCRILWIQKWWSNQTYLSIWFHRSNMWLIGQTGKQTKFAILWLDEVSKGRRSSSWMPN